MTTAKEIYRSFCLTDKDLPVFLQAWHLDAVCTGELQWAVVVAEENGRIAAVMPYVYKHKLGLKIATMPPLTPFLGPYIVPSPDLNYRKTLAREHRLLKALIEQLPTFDLYEQNFSPAIRNRLAFVWAGFQDSVRYTYRFERLNSDRVWSEMTGSYRNKIKKAQSNVRIEYGYTADEFYDILLLTFKRQGLSAPFGREFFKAYDVAVATQGARIQLFAVDDARRIHSALYLLYDDRTAYVHLVGEDPELRKSGAGMLLIYEAIRYAEQELGLQQFDFEGSMLPNIERVRRDFGARQVPYYTVRKARTRWLRVLQALRGR